MYREILQQIGLNKNEAKIYEALVGLGSANISTIASASKVNRRNVYDSLKNLFKCDLVIRMAGPGEHLYKAAEPKKLRHMLDSQRKKIGTAMPELKKLYNAHIPDEQTFVSRGAEGIKNFWNYVMNQKETVFFVGGKGAWHDPKIEQDRKQYFEVCKKKGIKIQGIFDYEMKKSGQDIYSQYDTESIRFFPKDYSTQASYDICGNRVVLFPMPTKRSMENSRLFNIVSQSLADSYRVWFKLLWHKAKSLKDFD